MALSTLPSTDVQALILPGCDEGLSLQVRKDVKQLQLARLVLVEANS